MSKKQLIPKKVIVFSYEGKNNKTEYTYFSHFIPSDADYILKPMSSGETDVVGMIKSTRKKRQKYGYSADRDLTYIFIDADADSTKRKLISNIKNKMPSDIRIIVSDPCFELWFLNHFIKTGKEYSSSKSLINELNKYIAGYAKTCDVYTKVFDKKDAAIANSLFQLGINPLKSNTEVVHLFTNNVIKDK